MKRGLLFFLIALGLSSCAFFETEKISSDTFYEEEMKEINWKDVDQYPVFSNCETLSEKNEQKECFEHTLATHIHESISANSLKVSEEINDTMRLDFSVNKDGLLAISHIKMDSITKDRLPLLEEWILQSLATLQPIAPAYKRGIPVETTFNLPILIRTE